MLLFLQPSKLIFGTIYPAYKSFKALQSRDNQECERLMMYWVVFTAFCTIEGWLDLFIGFWMPFYYESKLIFIFWLVSPYCNGAKFLYDNFVKVKLEQHEEIIDEYISYFKDYVIGILWNFWGKVSVYMNFGLLILFEKTQGLFLQYMHAQTRNSLAESVQHLKILNEPTTIKAIAAVDSTDSSKPLEPPINSIGGESTDQDMPTTVTSLSTSKAKRTRRVKKKIEVDQLEDFDGDEPRRATKRVTRSATNNTKAKIIDQMDVD